MKISRVLALFLVVLIMASGCYTERISNQNLSYLYDRDASFLHPEFNILHKDDSVTELHFRINSNELLYLQHPESKFYSAFFRIRYEVYTQLESKLLIDSSVVLFADSNLVMDGKTISGILTMKPSQVKQALLKIDLVDLRRNSHVRRYYQIDRENPSCRQFFTLRLADSGYPLSRSYVKNDEVVILSHSSGAKSAKVRFYHREFPLPKPPFSVENPKVFDYEADSIFTMQLDRPFNFRREGFYHIQLSDSTKHGFTLYRYKESFPEVKTVQDLIEPLRFINSNSEYKTLTDADFPKAEVDRFWLKLAGNQDRAKLLIQKFYSRVEDSNEFFTSYTEGWRTDRGLIYLIFGPPNIIYKNSASEHWIYGEEDNASSLGLTFYKVENPFSDNDFRLDRSPIYKSSWYSAVDMWRQGRVYTDN
ncbi:MAG: GWxTD domain-containing protein [Flavobacteriales bacterium]|nr:GWxTD domain-containing protein [Flavobacteriales bacterium]